MQKVCGVMNGKGVPCKSIAVANGRCLAHQGKHNFLKGPSRPQKKIPKAESSAAPTVPLEFPKPEEEKQISPQEPSKPEKEKAMPKRCGAKTKNGETCKAWAMDNGFCHRHGGGTVSPIAPSEPVKEEKLPDKESVASPEPPKPKAEKDKSAVTQEPTEKKKEKPIAKKTSGSKKSPKKEKKKSKVKKCGVITARGTPCKLRAEANGFCRMHQSMAVSSKSSSKQEKTKVEKSTIPPELSKPESEKPKAEKCGVITSKGVPCKNWAMANGRCRSHQVKLVDAKAPSKPKEEASKTEKPAASPKPSKQAKEKPIAEKCGVMTSRGTPCEFRAVANGHCRMHQSKPTSSEKMPKPEKEKRKERESETTMEEQLAGWLRSTVNLITAVGEKVINQLFPKDSSNQKKKKQ